jgi:hypothetical protein
MQRRRVLVVMTVACVFLGAILAAGLVRGRIGRDEAVSASRTQVAVPRRSESTVTPTHAVLAAQYNFAIVTGTEPKAGSATRVALMNAARTYLGYSGKFFVHYLRVEGSLAVAVLETEPVGRDDLHELGFVKSSTWRVARYLTEDEVQAALLLADASMGAPGSGALPQGAPGASPAARAKPRAPAPGAPPVAAFTVSGGVSRQGSTVWFVASQNYRVAGTPGDLYCEWTVQCSRGECHYVGPEVKPLTWSGSAFVTLVVTDRSGSRASVSHEVILEAAGTAGNAWRARIVN